MTLTITDDAITSDVTAHTGQQTDWQADAGWRVTWLPDRLLTTNEAITGMTIAEQAGAGPSPLLTVLAEELGLTGSEAIRLATAADVPAADGTGNATDEARYRREHTRLWGATVRDLTAAVRLRHPRSGQLDFADFLASALAAVAGNVGSTDRIVAGRPGSWEAYRVNQLVGGTVGYDQDEAALAVYRTEPLVVPLNVHDLMFRDVAARTRGIDTPYEQETDALYERLEPLSGDEYEVALVQVHAEEAALKAWWAAAYAAYAEAFAAAVAREAAQIEGLGVPVTLWANIALDGAGPDGLYDQEAENPDEYDFAADPLVLRLWQAARGAVPLPTRDGTNPAPAEPSSQDGVSRVTVAGFAVTITRSASDPEATS